MKPIIETQSDFEKPRVAEDEPNLLYFSKKSPFKETCNEDALTVIPIPGGYVFAVADGAGGHPKGEEAAETVLQSLVSKLSEKNIDINNLRASIVDAIEEANKYLINQGVGAKTTLTVCEVIDNMARGYQVGDSTLVVCGQKGKLKYRTTAHSPVGYQVEAGVINDTEAIEHPDLHYISNLVGQSEMKIEIGPQVELNPNDTIFLASDGLFDNFPPDDIIEKVRKGTIPEVSAELMQLIDQGIYENKGAKKDDISLILFRNC